MSWTLAALPRLKATVWPTGIVNRSSISGLGGDFGQAAHATSKGDVTHLPRSMALDHAKFGIRVNAVCPRREPACLLLLLLTNFSNGNRTAPGPRI